LSKRVWLALLPVLVCLLPGCFWSTPAPQSSWLKQFNNQAISPDHALIEFALIERILGDDVLNQQVWQHTDQLIDGLERHGMLADNGFRIGQLVGAPPQDLQTMLLGKESRSNAMIFPAGKTRSIPLGPIHEHTSFDLVLGDQHGELHFLHARYALDVVAAFASDGRTKLTFTPMVEAGDQSLPFRAAPDQSMWELSPDKPSKKFTELSWSVTLGQNEYLLVGGRIEQHNSLGMKMFSQIADRHGVQRLLVIRNCRSITAQDTQQNSIQESIRAGKSLPLAVQATLPVVRAKGN
jgi:hypothetical protein